jgi:CarD family transcriptional regulator
MKKSTNTPQKTTFQEKQHVVYPLQGVGRIDSVEEREFQGSTLLYYVIYLEVTDMTVMVPVDKAEELGIRAIVPSKEANQALKLISEEYEPVTADWKMRYQMNLDLLKKGSVKDIATVVRTLYHRSKIKELPILERKLFDSALRLLVDEVSFSLEKPKSEVEQIVFGKLETEHPPKPPEEAEPEGEEGNSEAPVEEDVEEE